LSKKLKKESEPKKKIKPPNFSKSVEICPRCGSFNIELSSKFDAWLTPKNYICKKCGYKGPVVLELEPENKEKNS
jgi:predicted RNA-binding Zn-ribbon protein involved in translation (DUF1610 family)